MSWSIATFYEFAAWSPERVQGAAQTLEAAAARLGIVGLCVVAVEGVNGTCAAESPRSLEFFLEEMRGALGLALAQIRRSASERAPFAKFRAPVRAEIVTLGDPSLKPTDRPERRLSPAQFHAALSDPNVVIVDTRNWYETRIGKFRGAIEPKTDEFQEFAPWLRAAALPRDQTVLIYCTGGIRCEKAILEMDRAGFSDVRQLDGGILNYLAHYPDEGFEGECFVFDRRVAVDQRLAPSRRYRQCPHCGQPATERLACVRCDAPCATCADCAQRAREDLRTCSKNCAHHWRLAPGKRGRPSQRSV